MARAVAIAFGSSIVSAAMVAPAFAQSNATGTIFGQVSEAAGSTVLLENLATGVRRSVTPDARGRYQATSMPPGRYKVQLQRNGAVERTLEVEALVGQGIEASFDAVQTVTVSSVRKTIDVSNTNNGAIFNAKQLDNLPIAQNVGAIIQLAPGTNRGDNRIPGPSFGGAGASENAFYINGFPVTNILTQVGSSELPFGAIANAQILTGGYSAEFGRSTGGVVNITTKTGTNRWEAGASVQYAPNSLRASQKNTYYPNTGSNPKTDGQLYQWNEANKTTSRTVGAYVGGPLIRDQLFFFVAAEQQRSESESVGATTATLNSSGGYTENVSKTPRYLAKLDYHLNDNHHFEYTRIFDKTEANSRYYGWSNATKQRDNVYKNGMSWVNCCGPANAGATDNIFKYTGYLTDKLTLTTLYGKSKTTHVQTPDGYNPDILQVTAPVEAQIPGFAYTTPQTVSGNLPAPGSGDWQRTLRVDVEYKLGNHSLRIGIDRNKVRSVTGESTAGGGYWTYNRYADPGTLPYGAQISPALAGGYGKQGYFATKHMFYDTARPSTDQSAQYIEDRYQATDNLLLSIGLRNEQFTNYNTAGQPFISQRHQLAPRLGVSWDVKGDSSFRVFANAGRYHLQMPTNVARNAAGNTLATDTYYVYSGIDPATGAPTGLVPLGPTVSVSNAWGQPKDARQVAAQNIKANYQDELALGFEKAWSDSLNIGAMATYRKLRSTNDDYCDPRPIHAWAVRNKVDDSHFGFQCAIINPGADNTLLLDIKGDGNLVRVPLTAADIGLPKVRRTYVALNLFAEHPLRNGWYGKVLYTWSQNKGNSEGQVDTTTGSYQVAVTPNWDHPELMRYSTGLLPNNHTHVVKAFGYYQVTPEWNVGGNLNLTSGRPINCMGNLPKSENPDGQNPAGGYGSNFFYCDGKPAPRGSRGILPWDVQLGLNVAYQPLFLKGLRMKVDVFNVLNRQTALSVSETYNTGDRVDPSYQRILSRSSPRATRFTLEYNHKF
ncbi:TonB-dependent receptor [Massilia sp. YIM B04103]|uniref:TonB-dependent receptor n=1 Tax=Massilia sp. YIM B04103 TaxID=2963106 RepID=UPI00210DD723|nr:TonB-dependent receptor [Massilia sp. YIM B04103]